MAYQLERLFDSDGSELSNPLHTTSLGGATNMEYDGRYLWVACAGGVAIYEWWGAASDHEPAWNTLDELTYWRYDEGRQKKLRLVTFITVANNKVTRSTTLETMKEAGATVRLIQGGSIWTKVTALTPDQVGSYNLQPYWIKKCAGRMYVTSGANFHQIFEFSIETQNLLGRLSCTEAYLGTTNTNFIQGRAYPMKSNLGVSGAKLWYVGSSFGDDSQQRLYSFDPVSRAKTITPIPVRPALARTWITTGYNGSVYIANYNNVSVSRFSDVTGAFQTTIRLNAFPTHAFTGPDRRIWVSSFAGMLSYVDHDDDGVHNDFSAGVGDNIRAVSLFADPTDGSKVWFVNNDNKLVRQDINTHEDLESAGPGVPVEDWNFTHEKLINPEQMFISQQFSYQDESLQSHVVKPYLFMLQNGMLLAFRLESYLYREVYATANGQAAVTMGPQEYFGE